MAKNPKDDLSNLDRRTSGELAALAGHQKNLLAYPDGGSAHRESWRVSKATFVALGPTIATMAASVYSLLKAKVSPQLTAFLSEDRVAMTRDEMRKLSQHLPLQTKVIFYGGLLVSAAIGVLSYVGMLNRYKAKTRIQNESNLGQLSNAYDQAVHRETGQSAAPERKEALFERERLKDQIEEPRIPEKKRFGVLAVAKVAMIAIGAVLHIAAHKVMKSWQTDDHARKAQAELGVQLGLAMVDTVGLVAIDHALTNKVKKQEKQAATEQLTNFDAQMGVDPSVTSQTLTHLERQAQRNAEHSGFLKI